MKKVLILIGPTGVGKTAVSMHLAKSLGTEIISADSMQIYRHMDIGTAKPSARERQAVRHHMIDCVEPWETYSTGAYIKDAKPIIDALLERRKTPIITGGTGLYIKAMTRGIFSGPSADWTMRSGLLAREGAEPGFLYDRLKSIDPEAAAKIMPADTRRIIRAIEVCMKSSRTISELHRELTAPLPYEFLKIGLTRERKELYRMIEQRVDAMMEQGLAEEVKGILEMIDEHFRGRGIKYSGAEASASLSSMQAIGYKELAMHLSGAISLGEAVVLIKKRTRNYAKRQFTWFRKEEGIRWVDVTGMHDAYEIFEKVRGSVPDG